MFSFCNIIWVIHMKLYSSFLIQQKCRCMGGCRLLVCDLIMVAVTFFQLLSSSPIRIPSSRLHQIRRVSEVFNYIFSNRMKSIYIILKYIIWVSFLLNFSSIRGNRAKKDLISTRKCDCKAYCCHVSTTLHFWSAVSLREMLR